MAKRNTKEQRELAEKVCSFYDRYFNGVEVMITDLPAIYRDIEDAILNGTAEEKVPIMVGLWRAKAATNG